MQQPHGNTGNTNAIKTVKKTSTVVLRCTSAEKAKWGRCANGRKLSQWVTETLNKAAKK